MHAETEDALRGWRNLTIANNDPWPPSKRHMDFCLGTLGFIPGLMNGLSVRLLDQTLHLCETHFIHS